MALEMLLRIALFAPAVRGRYSSRDRWDRNRRRQSSQRQFYLPPVHSSFGFSSMRWAPRYFDHLGRKWRAQSTQAGSSPYMSPRRAAGGELGALGRRGPSRAQAFRRILPHSSTQELVEPE